VYDLVPAGRLTMVADATRSVPITFAFLDRLAAAAQTPEASYVSAMMAHPFVRAGLAQGQPAFWWDPLAAVSALIDGSSIIAYERDRIVIVQDGPSAGRTVAVGPHQGGALVRVAVRADQARFEDEFLGTLNGARRP
jgi:inosine-uridine nucleoside N-ribohydrolase